MRAEGPLAAALAPQRAVVPTVKPISQAAFRISGDDAFLRCVGEVVSWMRRRNREIPQAAFNAEAFRTSAGAAFPAEAVLIDSGGPRLWAATLEDTREQQSLGRTWVTEISVGEHNGSAAFGARLSQVLRGPEAVFQPSRPGCVQQVLSKLTAFSDGALLTEEPAIVDDSASLDRLISLLANSKRKMPVVVLSKNSEDVTAVDPDRLAQRISGLAHTYVLQHSAAWELTRKLGKANSTFMGAVRLYRPGFDPLDGNPFDHPLWLFHINTVLARASRLDQIVGQVTALSVRAFAGDDEFPRYEEVRQFAAKAAVTKAREAGTVDRELLELYEDENERLQNALRLQKSEHDAAIQLASDELKRAETVRDEALADRSAMRIRLTALEAALSARGQTISDEPLSSYDDIDDWSKKHLSGEIWIARKAIRETEKNGQFDNIEFFGRTLILLRDHFVPMKRNPGAGLKREYDDMLRALSLSDEPCFSQRGSIKSFPEYKVTYEGKEYWCDNHIKYGGGTDPRSFFRIYYYWHEEDGILLIGHMPSHLDNKLTN
ncbi:hypothetical protein [Terrarubrum flagellatum]|uniref:hypothetical protein n=1 Tax=Terrirubrum flagellatum TaxID=2895980 RepID=UPI0031450DCE